MAQVLTQEEVDALLRGVSDGEIETHTEEVPVEGGVIAYDLASQERIIRGRMPTLDIINQRFARLVRNSLSSMLRTMVDVTTLSTDTLKFGKFMKSLPVPASLHIFRMDPLRGFGLFIAESKLVFSLVDIFFGGGGSAHMKVEGRDFTTIEQKMIKKVVASGLEDLEKAWKPVHDITVSYVRSEVNPQFAAVVPQTDVILSLVFEVELLNTGGTVTICLPYSTIEPIVDKLKAGFQSDQFEVDHEWLTRLRNKLTDVEVDVAAILGETTIKGRDLMSLKKGDIIQLDNDAAEPLVVTIENVPKLKGYPGVFRGNKAVKITKF